MFITVQVVPTGVKAEIGGSVGDAVPSTNVLAGVSDLVITHPNVVNGVLLNEARENVAYVEGFLLDEFLKGNTKLEFQGTNKIGVVLDSAADKTSLELALNTIETMRSNAGADIIGYTLTEKAVGARAVKTKSGAFVGEIKDENTFLKPAEEMIKKGANAIAVATVIKIEKKDLQAYLKGKAPNPYGGTEALISRTISKELKVPVAHAPMLREKEIINALYRGHVDPRAAAESASSAFLGCIIKGLMKAPHASKKGISIADVDAIVVPYSCAGGIPALAADYYGIPLIAVKENKTVLNVTPETLGLKAIVVSNYLEAAGVLEALKQGISIESTRRPLKKVAKI